MCFRGEALRALDIFGAPIGLNYKGENTFSTKIGGLFTLILYVLLVSLAATEIINLITHDTSQQVISA